MKKKGRDKIHECDAHEVLSKDDRKLKLGKRTSFVPILEAYFQFGYQVFSNIQFSYFIVELTTNLIPTIISLTKKMPTWQTINNANYLILKD